MDGLNYNDNQWILVEDDLDDQILFKRAFKNAGVKNELVILANGEEALTFIKDLRKPPFVIISDINMPKMTGLELLKEVKHDKMTHFKSIPFLIISSSTSEEEIALTYKSGAQGYFSKTMTNDDLVKLILGIENYWSMCRHPALLKG